MAYQHTYGLTPIFYFSSSYLFSYYILTLFSVVVLLQNPRYNDSKIHQAEDLTLKSASAIFGVDLLNCLDVSQSASREYEAAISQMCIRDRTLDASRFSGF